MDKLVIQGPCQLSGTIQVSKSKNACLPILCASLLNAGKMDFKNLPDLADIKFIVQILEDLGAECSKSGDSTVIDCSSINKTEASYDLVRKMRASILVLGPLLARFKRAKVSLPGGCAIGSRPIDIHLNGLKQLGAEIEMKGGYVEVKADRLKGAVLDLEFPSVGATEHLMTTAVYAEGVTEIRNAAREPEIVDLQNFLNAMGAKVEGAGTSAIKIQGVSQLATDFTYTPIPDRIEAATFIMMGLMTNSEITVEGIEQEHIQCVLDLLEQAGAKLEINKNSVKTKMLAKKLQGIHVTTMPYPGFPTDVQAQMMTLMTQADSFSHIEEKIFENRFMHVPELLRMGASIWLKSNMARIEAHTPLTAAPVMCTDLRASAALVMAALVAEGESTISRVYHIDRGYEKIDQKLRDLGVNIKRIKE